MPTKQTAGIIGRVEALARPIVEGLGLMLWDVEFKKEGTLWFLRIFIDKEKGVTLDDCERVSRALDQPLDDASFLDKSYYLEVSSPGAERVLRRAEHYASSIGSVVRLRLFSPRDGRKTFKGVLLSYSADELILDENGTKLSFAPGEIALAQTVYDFI